MSRTRIIAVTVPDDADDDVEDLVVKALQQWSARNEGYGVLNAAHIDNDTEYDPDYDIIVGIIDLNEKL